MMINYLLNIPFWLFIICYFIVYFVVCFVVILDCLRQFDKCKPNEKERRKIFTGDLVTQVVIGAVTSLLIFIFERASVFIIFSTILWYIYFLRCIRIRDL